MDLIQPAALRGHGRVLSALERGLVSGRGAQAYLFEGPEGCGKMTVATMLAARIACLSPPETGFSHCNKCPSCLAFRRTDHPDVSVLARDGASIRIDQIRDMTRRLRYEPVLAAAKIVIVDEADCMREEAQNAMLKTLEEPPSSSVFVLVTARPTQLLTTILSRCRRIVFGALSAEDVCVVLEREGVEPSEARVVAPLCEGSLRRARELCDPARMGVLREVTRFALEIGTPGPDRVLSFVELLPSLVAGLGGEARDDEAETRASSSDAGPRLSQEGLVLVLDVLRGVLRDAFLMGQGVDPARLPTGGDAARLHTLAVSLGPERIADAIARVTDTEASLRTNPNPRLALEALLLAVNAPAPRAV